MVVVLEDETLDAYADVRILRQMIHAIERAKSRALRKGDKNRWLRMQKILELHYAFCKERGIDLLEVSWREDPFHSYMAAKKRLGL